MPKGIYKRTKKHLDNLIKRGVKTRFKKGYKMSKETLEKMKKTGTLFTSGGQRNNIFGKKNWFKKGNKINVGEKHPNWQGGISFESYSTDWTKTLRRSIRERDNYICQLCDKLQSDRVHSVHHIDYNKKNCNPENLITLCVSCNSRVNYNKKRWIRFFKRIIKIKQGG